MPHSSELHKNAFWIYGVLVGLAIREIVGHVIQRWIEVGLTDPEVSLDVWRLAVFVLVIIRFYLGSSLYFNEFYANEKTCKRYRQKSYVIDFLVGLGHFAMFYACATSIKYHHLRIKGELSHFLFLLSAILLYDVIWYAAVRRLDTKHQIAKWTKLNVITVLLCAALYLSMRLAKIEPPHAEYVALVPVVVASLVDLSLILKGFNAASQDEEEIETKAA